MKVNPKGLLTSVRWSILYITLISASVCIIIVWTSYQRISAFEQAHKDIAKSSIIAVSKEISGLIHNYRRLVKVFAESQTKLISKLSVSPEDEHTRQQIDKLLGDYLPGHFSFTITNRLGIPLIDDFDGRIGEVCLNDIAHANADNSQLIRVHPNPFVYHIDIMTEWGNLKNGGIFFVSFDTDALAKTLKLSSPYGHDLMLVSTDGMNLIEITEDGARINLPREDFRLTMEEQSRILYSVPVDSTGWKLIDFHEPELFTEHRNRVFFFSSIIISFFILGSLLITRTILRSEKKRIAAEHIQDEMFSLFNHDLRTPLSSIYGIMRALTTPNIENPEKNIELAEMGFESAKIMLGLVNDILDIQKMESGEMSFDFHSSELTPLVQDTLHINYQYGKINNVEFKLVCPDEKIYIKTDKRRFQQMLTNLLSNAVKFSPDNSIVTVSISATKDSARISVSDLGPGIPVDFQPLVFQKFAQSKSGSTKSTVGTGLGLTIVKYIVDRHDGRVYFDTDIGKGTTFHIDLPVYLENFLSNSNTS